VEAEIVRDVHLSASGLLDRRIGGPSVFPPLGDEFVKITFRSQLPWKTSTGGNRYRRGMYTFFKRSVPYPDLMLFDCPDANAAAVQRSVSNTPLQALAALNSETCLEAARGLAVLALDRPEPRDAVQWMFRRCLTRRPTPAEMARLAAVHQAHQQWYAAHPADAQAMAAMAEADSQRLAAAAALTATANVIMNLDEFITRE
jgi:hypothetical protein